MARYKYLNYIPKPIRIPASMYDLVNDDAFCIPDGRIPLLMMTQFGIFPSPGTYPGHGKYDYPSLMMFRHQVVAIVRRGYISDRERNWIEEHYLDDYLIEKIKRHFN